MTFIKQTTGAYASIEEAYRTMKTTRPIPQNLETANIYRRECGWTGFLVALQQAIKGKLISREFYSSHRSLINDISTLCNEMDKNNFEVLLSYGKYEGNAIPSPYAFFTRLNEQKIS